MITMCICSSQVPAQLFCLLVDKQRKLGRNKIKLTPAYLIEPEGQFLNGSLGVFEGGGGKALCGGLVLEGGGLWYQTDLLQ